MSLLICKAKNGFIITDQESNSWVAKGVYDVSDVVRDYFKEKEAVD